jgi:Sulfotransferase domain.
MKADEPIFILGNPRSGTSLIRLMLNSHPDITIPPECGFIQWWYSKYAAWSLLDSNDALRVQEFVNDVATSRKIETWHLNFEMLEAEITSLQPSDYGELCACVYSTYAKGRSRIPKVWGDKNNYYIHHLQELNYIYPNAKYVAIVRDGRDVACSYRGVSELQSTSVYRPNLPIKVEEIAAEWTRNNTLIRDFFLSKVKGRSFTVRYEDLVQSPATVLTQICDFLKLKYSPQMLEYHKSNSLNEDEPKEFIDWKKKTLTAPDANNINKFQKILSVGEIAAFNEIADMMLKLYGYTQ